jgi:hypothetical protein
LPNPVSLSGRHHEYDAIRRDQAHRLGAYSLNVVEKLSVKGCSTIERIFYVARKAAKYPRVPLSVRSWSSPPASVSLRSSSKVTL